MLTAPRDLLMPRVSVAKEESNTYPHTPTLTQNRPRQKAQSLSLIQPVYLTAPGELRILLDEPGHPNINRPSPCHTPFSVHYCAPKLCAVPTPDVHS